MHPTNFKDPVAGFPGDACELDNDCHFGPRRCNGNICAGVSAWSRCLTSVDCAYGHYCTNFACIPVRRIVLCSYQL